MTDPARPARPPADGAVSRLLIEYDGTDFAGWARQPGLRTVQDELERALATILRREAVSLTVAGRTDAGVHAVGQVASYSGVPARVLALNALLPYDIAVLACEPAPVGFSARHDATSRAYRYRILRRRTRSAFERRWALHWPHPLELDALHACAALSVGTHDFTAFTPTETDHVRFERVVASARWIAVAADPDHLDFWIEADAFMHHMIRALVGTMLDVARGRFAVEQFAELLSGAPRAAAGPTAPPQGLTFIGAGYDGRAVLAFA